MEGIIAEPARSTPPAIPHAWPPYSNVESLTPDR